MKKEKTLSKKRELIRKYLIDIGLSYEESERVLTLLTEQDKQFIKEILDEIDKSFKNRTWGHENLDLKYEVLKDIKQIIKQKAGFEDLE